MFTTCTALISRNQWRSVFIATLLAAALTLSPVLKADFVNWDDNSYVVNNPRIVTLSPHGIHTIFTTSHRGLYKPVTILSFALDYKIGKFNPAIYHTSNYLLHLANCALVLFILMELGASPWAALFAGLIFALHPLQVESVAWVSERKELLHAFFALASIYLYQRWTRNGNLWLYAVAPLLFALGLMAKPQGVALPFALILVDWAGGRTFSRKAVLDKIPFFALAGFFGALALFTASQGHEIINRMDFSFIDNICVAAYALTAYLWRFFIPAGLSAVYPYPVKTAGMLPAAYAWAPLYCAAVFTALAYAARHNRRALAGLAFFVVAIAPTLQLVPVTPSVAADHYAYMPYIGLACALAALAGDVLRRKPQWGKPLFAATGVFVVMLVFVSVGRARVWRDSESLWSDVIAKYPACVTAYSNRAVAYAAEHKVTAMRLDIETGLKLAPDNGPLLTNRCGTKLAMGQLDEALADCNLAIHLAPYMANAWLNRSLIREKHNDTEGALSDMKMSLSLDPLNAEIYARLASMYERKGDIAQATRYYTSALAMKPDFTAARQGLISALSKLGETDSLRAFITQGSGVAAGSDRAFVTSGEACLAIGNYQCAEHEFSQAIKLGAKTPALLTMRATSYGALHRFDSALADFKAALALDPKNIDAYYNRGFMLLALRDYAAALEDMNTVLKLKPNSTAALLMRGGLFLSTGRNEEAADDFTKVLAQDKTSSSALNNRAMAYAALGRQKEALDDIAAALAMDPSQPKPYLNRAALNMRAGNYSAAVDDADSAIAFVPDMAEAFSIRSSALAALGDCTASSRDFKRAQELEPALASARPPHCAKKPIS